MQTQSSQKNLLYRQLEGRVQVQRGVTRGPLRSSPICLPCGNKRTVGNLQTVGGGKKDYGGVLRVEGGLPPPTVGGPAPQDRHFKDSAPKNYTSLGTKSSREKKIKDGRTSRNQFRKEEGELGQPVRLHKNRAAKSRKRGDKTVTAERKLKR